MCYQYLHVHASISVCCVDEDWAAGPKCRRKLFKLLYLLNSTAIICPCECHMIVLTKVTLDLSDPDDKVFWFNHVIKKSVSDLWRRCMFWVLFKLSSTGTLMCHASKQKIVFHVEKALSF